MLDLRDLEAFAAVGHTLNFSRAAERLSIAQSALSQRVRRLERRLGVELFVRTTRTVTLTPAGQVLLERSRLIFDDVDDAVTSTQNATSGRFGRVVIGSAVASPDAALAGLMTAVRTRHPDVQISARQVPNGRILADLLAHRLDLAFAWEYIESSDAVVIDHPGLQSLEISRERFQLMLPHSHPLAGLEEVALGQFAAEPFLTYAESRHGSVFRAALFSLCRDAGFTPRVVEEVANGQMLPLLVASGVGLALLPPSNERAELPGCVHVPLAGTAARLRYSIHYRAGDDRAPISLAREIVPTLHPHVAHRTRHVARSATRE